jgi:hypothetical protein
MKSPARYENFLRENGYDVAARIARVDADGDCLFHAVARTVRKQRYSARFLRQLVASSALVSHPLLRSSCEQWKTMAEMGIEDFKFYSALTKYSLPLGKRARQRLHKRLLDPALYWGDEYALRVLSLLLRRRIVVICHNEDKGRSVLSLRVNRPRTRRYDDVFLVLRHEHYSALLVRAKS